jgi:hypothetical protein
MSGPRLPGAMLPARMPTLADDILTPRLALRLMEREAVEACLAGHLGRAEGLLGVRIPRESLALIARSGFAKIAEHMDEIDGVEHVYLREVAV